MIFRNMLLRREKVIKKRTFPPFRGAARMGSQAATGSCASVHLMLCRNTYSPRMFPTALPDSAILQLHVPHIHPVLTLWLNVDDDARRVRFVK